MDGNKIKELGPKPVLWILIRICEKNRSGSFVHKQTLRKACLLKHCKPPFLTRFTEHSAVDCNHQGICKSRNPFK